MFERKKTKIEGLGDGAVALPFPLSRSRLPLLIFTTSVRLVAALLISLTIIQSAFADVHYVNIASTNPVSPYTNWYTAATVIQNAIDVASSNDTVLVSNGVYSTGGRAVYSNLMNRVAVTKPMTLQSVNGPASTFIVGQGPCGSSAVRCAYITNGVLLAGFTITNGNTHTAGDSKNGRSGGGVWAEASGVISNCVMICNSASDYGGGVYSGKVYQSSIISNSAQYGGGAGYSTIQSSTMDGNSSWNNGGAAYYGAVKFCQIINNTAVCNGGGLYSATAENCRLIGNSAGSSGGAAKFGRIAECSIISNSAAYGGGTCSNDVRNCTIMENHGSVRGGGAYEGSACNSIIYYNNTAGDGENWHGGAFTNCCTTPTPNGSGNFAAEPGVLSGSNPHIVSSSPCINAGGNAYSIGCFDIDLEGRTNGVNVDVGCDEYWSAGVTGAMTATISAVYTQVAVNYSLDMSGAIAGMASGFQWDFADGNQVADDWSVSHSWSNAGLYAVTLTAWNNYDVAAATQMISVVECKAYVATNGSHQTPFATWGTAATNIQSAVDAVAVPGGTVWVADGRYDSGGVAIQGTLTNRVAITRPMTVRSVNGPGTTIIAGKETSGWNGQGDGAIRCAYLTNGAYLIGFTLTNGHTRIAPAPGDEQNGGGVWAEKNGVISNCVVKANCAQIAGGGVFGGQVFDCTLRQNYSDDIGGGACSSVVRNTTINLNSVHNYGAGCAGCEVGNSTIANNSSYYAWTGYGGGAYDSTLYECVISSNHAQYGGAVFGSVVERCSIAGNTAECGAGASDSELRNCAIVDNAAASSGGGASVSGGGAWDSCLKNCFVNGNSADYGGGVSLSAITNCTIVGNSASICGGGVHVDDAYSSWPAALNSIVYFNDAPEGDNWWNASFTNSCTTPSPPGSRNLVSDPGLLGVNSPYVASNSICVNAGTNIADAGAFDFEWESRTNGARIDIGCDEFWSARMTGIISASLAISSTQTIKGLPISMTCDIQGRASSYSWTFGDGSSTSACTIATHSWNALGTYPVVLRAWNNDMSVAATAYVEVVDCITNYVSPDGGNVAPFTDWESAASNIQDAIDIALPGSVILVSDGVYMTGGKGPYGGVTNRIVIDKPVTVRSLNGPANTVIVGSKGTWSLNAIRCAYVANGAILEGFTLTNGYAYAFEDGSKGGGAFLEDGGIISNSVIAQCYAKYGGGISGGLAVDCLIVSNTATYGGGAAYGGLRQCALINNQAHGHGGGVYHSIVENCLVATNDAQSLWGDTSVGDGGGTCGGIVRQSRVIGNVCSNYGAGCADGEIENSFIYGNRAVEGGGGVYNSTIRHCAVLKNSAWLGGGIAGGSIALNSIVYYNDAHECPNWETWSSFLTNSCTLPLATNPASYPYGWPPGIPVQSFGNFTNEPGLLGLENPHITAVSPCVNSGKNSCSAGAFDMDNEARTNGATVDVGCDEFWQTGMTGGITAAFSMQYTQVVVNTPVTLTSRISGFADRYEWDFGDGHTTANSTVVSYAWTSSGVYSVVLQAWNNDMTHACTTTVQVLGGFTNYVSPYGSHAPPYITWATAATNIQAAVDAAVAGGNVLVTNGTYNKGGKAMYGTMTNRIALEKPITVQSVNGPDFTLIMGRGLGAGSTNGNGAVRCAYVGHGAKLAGFTLTDGHTKANGCYYRERSGGGIWCEDDGLVFDCYIIDNSAASYGGGIAFGAVQDSLISGNSASSGGGTYYGQIGNSIILANIAEYGGGSAWSALERCSIESNIASNDGGGSCQGTLLNCHVYDNTAQRRGGGVSEGGIRNCTIVGNTAWMQGGGVCYDNPNYVENSIIYYNSAMENANWHGGSIANSCIVPLPQWSSGNFDAEPLIVALSNPHLLSDSPCIDEGLDSYESGSFDIDGQPRTNGVAVDVGCDEFYSDSLTGTLSVAISKVYTQAVVKASLEFESQIEGIASGMSWDFGDNSPFLTNRLMVSHSWTNAGTFRVVLTAWNTECSLAATCTVRILDYFTNYVSVTGGSLTPFTNWTTAATNIQLAIKVCPPGGTVIVGEGVYSNSVFEKYGARSRIGIDHHITVMAQNPDASKTAIRGEGSWYSGNPTRCAYLENGAALIGFTLTNGCTRDLAYQQEKLVNSGGGAWCADGAVVSHCIIASNNAYYYGGGIYGGIVSNSIIVNNYANSDGGGIGYSIARGCVVKNNSSRWGGGISSSTVSNSLIVGNFADWGGGAGYCVIEACTIVSNSASEYGGGVLSPLACRNSIIYFNNAPAGGNHYDAQDSITYSATTPYPSGIGNLTTDPRFVNPVAGDYHLLLSSPCIDHGVNHDSIISAVDLDGNPRILNGMVDMGAYETAFRASPKIFLQGPFNTNTHVMSASLTNAIPRGSPYATDMRSASAIPSNTTDWVLFELRDTNGNAVASRSAFVNKNGYVLSDNGSTGVVVDVSPNKACYLVVEHRNHLSVMSASPIAFTNVVMAYDFTTNSSSYYGGSNACASLEPGTWGLIAGDADGDGGITEVDRQIAEQQAGKTGYLPGDLNLNGVVSTNQLLPADDLHPFFPANLGRATSVPDGEVAFSPSLSINPSRKTILANGSASLTVSGATNPVTWFIIRNSSGGTLTPTTTNAATYQAGITSSCVDILEAWDGNYRFGRAYMNVISESEVALAGKAIIIAGWKGPDDTLWPTTDYLASLGYNTLLYRGFSKANVQYLSPVTGRDVDGNGAMDDIDMESTLANAAYSFTNFAGNANKLFVYLVDHGGDSSSNGFVRLGPADILTAAQLDQWLDDLQNAHTNMEITVLVDFCNSGSFLNELTYTGTAKRVVIAASSDVQPSYFVAGGLVSFSDAFFSGVLMGLDIKQSFAQARDAMSAYQTAWMDDNKDGVYTAELDGDASADSYIGASFVAGKDIPQIGLVCGNQLLTGDTKATLWANYVMSAYPIERVWCLIVPPGHVPDTNNPVSDIPELELTYNSTNGQYEAVYDGFSEDGTYKVMYYAKDTWGSVSLPAQSYVTQSGYDERVILVAGGDTNSPDWQNINSMGNFAYHTFRSRWFEATNIFYLNPQASQDLDQDGTNDVDGVPSLTNLCSAITDWAWSANKLTVYLIGQGSNNTLIINNAEFLNAADLDSWMDDFQRSNADACVVMDFAGSGGFLPYLTPPADALRVCVASAASGQASCRGNGGLVSFTQYFLSDIFSGRNIWDAFAHSQNAVRNVSGKLRQLPNMDDNADGAYSKTDGSVAKLWHIGTAFITGADTPTIGQVTPDTMLMGTNALLLWASDVTDMDGISNVWCVITAPDYSGEGDLPEINLTWNNDNNRYEALYTGFTEAGSYVCTFHASDNNGEISSPMQCTITTADDYEPDDTSTLAQPFDVGDVQTHNFHKWNDEDWVYFYAVSNYAYEIETIQQGTNVDTVLDLYYQLADGTLSHIETNLDLRASGTGEGEYLSMNFPDSGLYYVKVSSADTNAWGTNSAYNLSINIPIGGNVLLVLGINGLTAGPLPPGISANLDTGESLPFSGSTSVSFSKPDGTYTVTLTGVPAGWEYTGYPASQQVTVSASGGNIASASFVLLPCFRVNGSLKDAFTSEKVAGAAFQLTGASGRVAGKTSPLSWYSEADGTFPTNLSLPTENWNMQISKAGYSNLVMGIIGTNMPAGAVTNLGTKILTPVDTNGNGIADDWEAMYFGAGANVMRTEDADGDGLNNWQEYLLGTHPVDGNSALKIHNMDSASSNGLVLSWPVANGRTYRIEMSDSLISNVWPWTSGPWSASATQTNMLWTDTNVFSVTNKFYRIEVELPL